MNVALIKNDVVANMIVVESLQWAFDNVPGYDEIIDTTGMEIGMNWIRVAGVWKSPYPDPEPFVKSILTPLEFLNRFTNDEVKTIMALAKTDPDVELWWLKYNKAQDLDLNDPQTIEGVNMLETATILAPGRAAEILTKQPIS